MYRLFWFTVRDGPWENDISVLEMEIHIWFGKNNYNQSVVIRTVMSIRIHIISDTVECLRLSGACPRIIPIRCLPRGQKS